MDHPIRIALLWVIAVVAGVAISTLCYSFPTFAHPGGSLLFRQPILWLLVLIPVVVILVVVVSRWRRETH